MPSGELPYPARLRLANTPTALVPLRRYCAQHDLPLIWLKRDDLTHCLASGNKIRKLEFCLAEAREQKADVLITYGGLQSNHCRATAVLAAEQGFKAHLVLRGSPASADQPDGNLLLDGLLGAEISYVPARELKDNAEQIEQDLVEHYRKQGLTAYCMPIGASDATGLWAYVAASAELQADFASQGIAVQHIITASGSGGTHAGLIVGAQHYLPDTQVWGINVCDDEAWFQNKIRQDLRAWKAKYQIGMDVDSLPINVLDGYVGEGYARASDEVLKLIAELAAAEGVVFDPVYTGKAFHGLLQEIAKGRFAGSDNLVFIHTGGVFGLFPFRERLAAAVVQPD